MKRFNYDLNVSKLATKQLQLKAIENQLAEITAKANEVKARFEAKQIEVEVLTETIKSHTATAKQ
jgi:hypothetical protein